MATGLPLVDRFKNRDGMRYNWRRTQILTNLTYITKRAEKAKEVEAERLAKEEKKAEKPIREKQQLAEKEAKKAKKAAAKIVKEKEEAIRKEAREAKRKVVADKKEEEESKKRVKA